jgi:hypothetical protein
VGFEIGAPLGGCLYQRQVPGGFVAGPGLAKHIDIVFDLKSISHADSTFYELWQARI